MTKTGFRDWLAAKDPAEIVGLRAECNACPLAAFLRFTCGKGTVGVRVYNDDTGRHPLPPWAWGFVDAVDDQPSIPITAALALRLLDGAQHAA